VIVTASFITSSEVKSKHQDTLRDNALHAGAGKGAEKWRRAGSTVYLFKLLGVWLNIYGTLRFTHHDLILAKRFARTRL
jgi:hypothetical protein